MKLDPNVRHRLLKFDDFEICRIGETNEFAYVFCSDEIPRQVWLDLMALYRCGHFEKGLALLEDKDGYSLADMLDQRLEALAR